MDQEKTETLVKRLREIAYSDEAHSWPIYDEAADRIADLEAQIAEASGQIEWLDRENNRITAEYSDRLRGLDQDWQRRMNEVLDPVFQVKMLQPPAPMYVSATV